MVAGLLVVRLTRAGRLPHHLPLTAVRLISGISCGGLTGEPAALLGQQSEAAVPAVPAGATQPEERLNRALYSLDLGVQQTGRVSRTQLEAAALLLATARPNPSQALLLIRLCGAALVDLAPSARTALLDRISSSLEVAAVTAEYDVSHHNAIIRVQLDNDNPTAAAEAVTGTAKVLPYFCSQGLLQECWKPASGPTSKRTSCCWRRTAQLGTRLQRSV